MNWSWNQNPWTKNKYYVTASLYWDRASDVFKRFATYLNILDQDPEALARMLQRFGIKGKRGKPNCCPVAVYLSSTPALAGVKVGADTILFNGRHIPLPKNVQEFIKQFDAGYYPELEAS